MIKVLQERTLQSAYEKANAINTKEHHPRSKLSVMLVLCYSSECTAFAIMWKKARWNLSLQRAFVGCGDRTWTCDLRVMRNPKFVRYSAVLLGFVVLRTKAQNGFCPMCTKKCHTVLTCSNFFWGQFWGQICKMDSDLHSSNKRAALVLLRNADTNITRFSHRKSPTNRYISFTLRQEVVRKHFVRSII